MRLDLMEAAPVRRYSSGSLTTAGSSDGTGGTQARKGLPDGSLRTNSDFHPHRHSLRVDFADHRFGNRICGTILGSKSIASISFAGVGIALQGRHKCLNPVIRSMTGARPGY